MLALALGVCTLGGALLLGQGHLKDGLLAIDSALFEGAVRRLYHGQALPSLPRNMPQPPPGSYAWLEAGEQRIIAHGFGGSDRTSANSIRALQDAITNGLTLIEGDFRLTPEGDLICHHGPNSGTVSHQDYLAQTEIAGGVPCYFSDVANVLRQNPGIFLVVDAKDDFIKTYQMIAAQAPGLLGQIIPQLYDFEQVQWVRARGFAGPLFTSYRSALTTQQIFDYAAQAHIPAVTLTQERVAALDHIPPEMAVFTHTINDAEQARALLGNGLAGVYSDTLLVTDLNPENP